MLPMDPLSSEQIINMLVKFKLYDELSEITHTFSIQQERKFSISYSHKNKVYNLIHFDKDFSENFSTNLEAVFAVKKLLDLENPVT